MIEKIQNKYRYKEILDIEKNAKQDFEEILVSELKDCKKPYLLEISKSSQLLSCMKGINRESKKVRENYCNCIISNLYNKYPEQYLLLRDSITSIDRSTATKEQLNLRDSMIIADLPLMKECFAKSQK